MIRRAVGRNLFCCPVGAEQDPAILREIQAYLMMSCRCLTLVEIGRDGIAVHFEHAGEADLFAEVWAEWAADSSASGEMPSERLLPRAERPSRKEKPDSAASIQNRAQIPPQWGDT